MSALLKKLNQRKKQKLESNPEPVENDWNQVDESMLQVETKVENINLNPPANEIANEITKKMDDMNLQSKKFKHGINIRFINSVNYKGMTGTVKEVFPAKYEIEVKKEEIVENNVYNKKIESVIEAGKYILFQDIKNIIDMKYESNNQKITKKITEIENVNLNTEYFYIYQEQEFVNVVNNVTSVDIEKKNQIKKEYDELITLIPEYDSRRTIYIDNEEQKLVDRANFLDNELSKNLKRRNLSRTTYILTKRISENKVIEIVKETSINKIEQLLLKNELPEQGHERNFTNNYIAEYQRINGVFGKISGLSPERLVVSDRFSVLLTPKQIEKIDSKRLRVKHGEYRGKEFKYIFHPVHLIVILESNNQTITHHLIKDKNGSNKMSLILPIHIRYHDIMLSQGTLAQVNKIVGENFSITTDNNESLNVHLSEIKQFMPGFNILEDTQNENGGYNDDNIDEFFNQVSNESNESNESNDDDFDENKEFDESLLEEPEEQGEEQGEYLMYEPNESNEQEYKSSYNDNERLTLDKTSLTDYQKYIKGILMKILKYYRLNVTEDIINIIYKIERNIDESKNIFLVVMCIFYELKPFKIIKKEEYMYDVLNKVYGVNYDKLKIIRENVMTFFTRQELGSIKKSIEKQLYQNVINEMFKKADEIIFPHYRSTIQSVLPELKLVPRKEKEETKFYKFKDILKNGLPEKEKPIVYNIESLKTLEAIGRIFKNDEIIKKNLYRLPYVLRNNEYPAKKELFYLIYTTMIKRIERYIQKRNKDISELNTENKRVKRNRDQLHQEALEDKIDREINAYKDSDLDIPVKNLREYCNLLNLNSSGTRDQLEKRLDICLGYEEEEQEQMTYEKFLKIDYSTTNMNELENIAEDLNMDLFERGDETKRELYERIVLHLEPIITFNEFIKKSFDGENRWRRVQLERLAKKLGFDTTNLSNEQVYNKIYKQLFKIEFNKRSCDGKNRWRRSELNEIAEKFNLSTVGENQDVFNRINDTL